MLVTVGTEHYQFDRLIDWIDTWLASVEGSRVECLIQHGVSRPSTRAESRAFMPFDEMLAATREASAIVCHGGTGSVMLSRHEGIKPIVVPRTHDHGEHVDNHQVVFARRMATRYEVEIAETEQDLHGLLDAVLDRRLDPRGENLGDGARPAITRFSRLMDELLSGGSR